MWSPPRALSTMIHRMIFKIELPGKVANQARDLDRAVAKPRFAAERNGRWCSEGFEIGCDNGEKVRVAFALDCCDREAMSFLATTGGSEARMCVT
jgi:transposase InsO family protein